KRCAARALAFRASSMRSLGSAVVTSESISLRAVAATSTTAAWNACSFALDGALKPESLRTNWSEAARISSSVAGGSKLYRVRMLRHMAVQARGLAAPGCAQCGWEEWAAADAGGGRGGRAEPG